jgi:hypothetical protein
MKLRFRMKTSVLLWKKGVRGGETKLVFSPKLVCTKVSTLVLDLPYLGLHCTAAHFLH